MIVPDERTLLDVGRVGYPVDDGEDGPVHGQRQEGAVGGGKAPWEEGRRRRRREGAVGGGVLRVRGGPRRMGPSSISGDSGVPRDLLPDARCWSVLSKVLVLRFL